MSTCLAYWSAGGLLLVPLFLIGVAIGWGVFSSLPRLGCALADAAALQAMVHGCGEREIRTRIRHWLEARMAGILPAILRHALDGDAAGISGRYHEACAAEVSPFRSRVRILRALVAAAPLVGLLGTVQGMIGVFAELSLEGAASMEDLSTGISLALITTQVGLVIALPGLVGTHAVARRLRALQAAFDRLESHLAAGAVRERATLTRHPLPEKPCPLPSGAVA